MFGFFKKQSQEDKLLEELAKAIQSTVNLAMRECPVKAMQGIHVKLAIDTCRQTALDSSHRLAQKYGLTVYQVYGIISKSHLKALEYFLE